jgi:hypothetical protein
MNAKDAIRQTVEFGHMVTRYYVDDLSDADLLVRSVPNSNHIAWQLGHLIKSTHEMLMALGRKPPALPAGFDAPVACESFDMQVIREPAALPAGFDAAYTRETATSDDPAKFAKKDEYLRLMDEMKSASLAAIDVAPEKVLDRPGPESMREYAPTVGAVLVLLGNHWLMHAGQFVPIRRKLGKPALF